MSRNIQEILTSVIKSATKDSGFEESLGSESFVLDLPTDSRFGDLSCNLCLILSKKLKKSPMEIAQSLLVKIRPRIEKEGLQGHIREIKVEGAGFLNFYFSDNYFYGRLKEILLRGQPALSINLGRKKPVLLEFVSANPTGPLSVAHARQAAVGDSLARVLGFCGFKVRKEFYLNDEGNQINILGNSIQLRLKELCGESITFPEDHYQGDYIRDIASQIKEKNLKPKDFAAFGADYILKIIKKELKAFGVDFDYWYSQKSLRRSGKIKKAFSLLEKKGFLYKQEGALWFKSTAFGDDKDRVVIKSDGSYTYLAPDIAYHQDKYRRGFSWLINLWGPDHHGYISRLKAAVQALGHNAQSISIVIVQLATIFRDGKPVQMSTRRGQYITLQEVLDEVGLDASRFFFLMRRTTSHLDFDLSVAKKQTPENPVYYVQYAHARICSILRSSPKALLSLRKCDFSLLKEKEELELIKKLCQFAGVLEVCVKTVDPYMLTVYLQEVAESFHKFYDRHRVLGDDPRLSQARLALISGVKTVLGCGLKLAGVSQPEKM